MVEFKNNQRLNVGRNPRTYINLSVLRNNLVCDTVQAILQIPVHMQWIKIEFQGKPF